MSANSFLYRDKVFNRVRSGNCYLNTSLPFSELQANSLSVIIETDDKSLLDFETDEKFTYIHKGKQVGVFHISKVLRQSPTTYKVSATSAIGILIKSNHNGGIYSGAFAEDVIADICGTIPFKIKSNLRTIKLYGWLPIASRRDNLKQVLLAIGATITTDLDGVLHIEGFWDGFSFRKPISTVYKSGTGVEYNAKVTDVEVTEHQFVEDENEVQLFEGTVESGAKVTFDNPMHTLRADGFSILESGSNYAVLSAGTGKLFGKEYLHNTRIIKRHVGDAREQNTKKITSCTLISLTNSVAIADRLVNYCKSSESINSAFVYGFEKPGDRGMVYHPFDEKEVDSVIYSIDMVMSDTIKANEKSLVGFVPPKSGEESFVDTRDVITEDTEWTVPDGVNNITVVCIGGGQGGKAGKAGERSPSVSAESQQRTSGVYTIKTIGFSQKICYPGKGGLSGTPGSGGKVLIETIDVSPGQKFSVKVGKGGVGAKYGTEDEGSLGTPSTFGSFSSDSGSSSESGYVDPITSEKYASKGEEGVPGGDGCGYVEEQSESGEMSYVFKCPDPIIVGDKEYVHGSKGPDLGPESGGNVNVGWGTVTVVASGGQGGGPAYGSNGEDGAAGKLTLNDHYENPNLQIGFAGAGPGGKGGDAIPKPKETIIGKGGSGGNGGGGAGAYSLPTYAENKYKTSTGTAANISCQRWGYSEGGAGSDGSAGADGGVIVYYSMPEEKKSGYLVTNSNRIVIDKNGRNIIV